MPSIDPCTRVRQDAKTVANLAKHVKIDVDQLQKNVEEEYKTLYHKIGQDCKTSWAEDPCHYFDPKNLELSALYIFYLDSLNFCFWPLDGFEYVELSTAIANVSFELILQVAKNQPKTMEPAYVAENMCPELLGKWLKNKFGVLPQLEERARLVKEVATVLVEEFDGSVLKFIKSANQSAAKLVNQIIRFFPGFRDQVVYKGRQIFMNKRSQIVVADLWGAFGGENYGYFNDMHKLTCFPDYRVPQVLEHIGLLKYSKELSELVFNKKEIPSGSEFETEIRSCTVHCVELLHEAILKKKYQEAGKEFNFQKARLLDPAIKLDWILWRKGEGMLDKLKPHHRTLTIFY